MIDLVNETVLPLAQAAEQLPACRNCKPPHYSTVSRWASHGIDGVKLEVIKIGATTCTSLEAIQRFAERCTNPSIPPSRSTKSRQRAFDKATQELDEAGI